MRIDWPEFKELITANKLSFSFTENIKEYELSLFLGIKEVTCGINKTVFEEWSQDFENNYKSLGNIPTPDCSSPFAAKRIGDKKLYKRAHGIQSDVEIGSNEIIFPIPYNWAKIRSLEVLNGESLDSISLIFLDSVEGTLTGSPSAVLNQFGFTLNIAKDYYENVSEFDADVYLGMQLKIIYNSLSNKRIGINFILNEMKS